jgi:hypothetical protein
VTKGRCSIVCFACDDFISFRMVAIIRVLWSSPGARFSRGGTLDERSGRPAELDTTPKQAKSIHTDKNKGKGFMGWLVGNDLTSHVSNGMAM